MSRIKKTPEIGTFNIGDCYVENLLKTLQFISLIQPIWDTTWSVSHREDAKNPVVLHPLRYGPTIKQTSKLSWFQTHLQNNIVNKSIPFIKNLNETCNHLFTSCLPQWFHKKKTSYPILHNLSTELSKNEVFHSSAQVSMLIPGQVGGLHPPQSTKTHGESDKPPGCHIREKLTLIRFGHG